MNRRTFVGVAAATMTAAKLGWGAPIASSHNDGASDGNFRPLGVGELVSIPVRVQGVVTPVISLNGEWECSVTPGKEFWKSPSVVDWNKIQVPGEWVLQGFSVSQDVEYPCRRTVAIPKDFSGKRIFLRFDGVYSYARLWINGTYLKDHWGGFTSWDCEITDLVTAGETMELMLGLTDRRDDISQESYYAHHSILGVLRDVRFFALPAEGITSLAVVPRLSDDFRTGYIDLAMQKAPQTQGFELDLHLTDSSGKRVPTSVLQTPVGNTGVTHFVSVASPLLWDAEHPYLYGLEVAVKVDGTAVQTHHFELGFRTVKVLGNELIVNGKPVKLRGVCRHSIHPLYGRAVPGKFDEDDVRLLRAANINFIRTSHYPPSEQFLRACDRHGIYLEEETAVSWSNLDDGPSSDPHFKDRFVQQFQEMLQRDKHHASVIFWSLGNESQWGENIAAERLYARQADPSRPLIFSYPDTIPWNRERCDIYSKHYAECGSDLGGPVSPVLHDEFAHVSCYNVETYRRDPGVRNFWGESISRFGNAFLATDGCLGGAIWAGIDEVFLLPDRPVGYGPWGIIDGWRREKPEYWLTKKAYSPIRLRDEELPPVPAGTALRIAVRNAFDHTNLRELNILWSTPHGAGKLKGIDIGPRTEGYLEIPPQPWASGDVIDLQFLRNDGLLIDHFKLPIGSQSPVKQVFSPQPIQVVETSLDLTVNGTNFSVRFDRETGLISSASFEGETVLEGGPFLDFGSGYFKGWILRQFEVLKSDDHITIISSGESRFTEGIVKTKVDFEIEIDGTGLITTRYRIVGNPSKASHLGIAYLLPAKTGLLSWNRRSQWSVYPDDHIGRAIGVALRRPQHALPAYRAQPTWPWSQDAGDGYDPQIVSAHPETRDFCSIKENIWSASLLQEGSAAGISVEGDADIAVRAASVPDGRVALSVFNYWSYPDLMWGNYTGPHDPPSQSVREVQMRLSVAQQTVIEKR